MRKAVTLIKKLDGSWTMASGPEVPYDKQRAAFDANPANNSNNGDIAEIKFLKISRETVKTRHYVSDAKPKEAKPKAAKKKAVSKD